METLAQYLTYNLNNNNILELQKIFKGLDGALKVFNEKGYRVDVNPSTIVYSDGMFVFSSFNAGITAEEQNKNILDLAKLAVGTYYSLPSGQFVDYTKIPTEYLRDNYDDLKMDSCIPKDDGDTYYRDTIVNGPEGVYYGDYLVAYSNSNINSASKGETCVVKSLGTFGNADTIIPVESPHSNVYDFIGNGKSSNGGNKGNNNKQAAFIDIVFYPILLAVFAMVGYAVSVILRVL